MLDAAGLGAAGALLLVLGTVTTNFVNIYMSSLALKSLVPQAGDRLSVWSTGLIGAALSLLSAAWLEQYATFMLVLGATLVPVGGVILAHFFILRPPTDVASLYARGGPCNRHGGFLPAGLAAWAAGAVAYALAAVAGGTLPALVTAIAMYVGLSMLSRANRAGPGDGRRE
jgi:purine-cytosine permease-like protein